MTEAAKNGTGPEALGFQLFSEIFFPRAKCVLLRSFTSLKPPPFESTLEKIGRSWSSIRSHDRGSRINIFSEDIQLSSKYDRDSEMCSTGSFTSLEFPL